MCNNNLISRRLFSGILSASIITHKPFLTYAVNEENRPLTPKELEEYNRLLKEAKNIKNIIKANKNALIDNDNENDKETFLRKNNITITK